MLGVVHLKIWAHLVQQPLAELLLVKAGKRLVVAGATFDAVGVDRPEAAFIRFQEHTAGRVFQQDLAGEPQLPTVDIGQHMLDGPG